MAVSKQRRPAGLLHEPRSGFETRRISCFSLCEAGAAKQDGLSKGTNLKRKGKQNMLAQSFKSAAELDISERQKDALVKTLTLLETGKLVHVPNIPRKTIPDYGDFTGHFNMGYWREHGETCGTVCCIAGTAELVGQVSFEDWMDKPYLSELFGPAQIISEWEKISVSQAATALRSYLTTGNANWPLVLGEAS
jgi:hypothetical protein